MQDEGLTEERAAALLAEFGPNALPEPKTVSPLAIFLRQFLSPLIYILVAAAGVSIALGDYQDAVFIAVVLLINGLVGTIQEHSAGRAAAALRRMEKSKASVMRGGRLREIDARDLVAGDLVLLEAGAKVPADLRLTEIDGMLCDESLLTGEAAPVRKAMAGPDADDPQPARAFAGTMVTRGRARGVVEATGLQTQFGRIAAAIETAHPSKPPLLVRLGRFSKTLAIAIFAGIFVVAAIGYARGMTLEDLFMVSVGLAVSAIPEGLPVAITVALAVAMRRMARSNVIIRNMPAVESLGSCTIIATDKTGTLTRNELTVTDLALPDGTLISFEAHPHRETIEEEPPMRHTLPEAQRRMAPLLAASILPNDARLEGDGDAVQGHGDTVDIALLLAAHEGGLAHDEVRAEHPLITRIPYEPDLKYAASFHSRGEQVRMLVKGAPETLIAMADRMAVDGQTIPIDRDYLAFQKNRMAERGLRILAFAEGTIDAPDSVGGELGHGHLRGLVFLGFAGMKDPLRPEVPDAISACSKAGISVAMVTGDDPVTASAIAREAGLDFTVAQVMTGPQLQAAADRSEADLDVLTRRARIYARVEPLQKLAIVQSLARNGHIVAVTGDGVNDAPALTQAHVGVAMGRNGTDIARESADIILTDDNFASIVEGVRQGRVAYANIRKVIFMLVATGAAEVGLFLLALPLGLPMPLLAVQLLWLNLVTNGIQDVALAVETAEGDELDRAPRKPDEPLFDARMTWRIALSALYMAGGGFALFSYYLSVGMPIEQVRNALLLLLVLFENGLTLSARSERNPLLGRNFLANPFLLGGVLLTQLLHFGAMHVPALATTLAIAPIAWADWLVLLALAIGLLVLLELEKMIYRKGRALRQNKLQA